MKKLLIFAMILFAMNFSAAHANKISAIFLVNDEIFDQHDDIIFSRDDFHKKNFKILLKNNFDFTIRPKIKINFTNNFGKKFSDKKNLPPIEAGKTFKFDIDLKNYQLENRKNSAWLQIWLSADKLLSDDVESAVWEKIPENIFSEFYFCASFEFEKIPEKE